MATKEPWEKLGLLTLGLLAAYYATLVWYCYHPWDDWPWISLSLWLAAFAVWIWVEFRHAGVEKRPRGWWLNRIEAAVLIGVGFAGFMVVPAIWMVRGASTRVEISSKLRNLALAMHHYHALNKQFPPIAVFDKDGRPLLSWRVLLLPYLEEDDLYKQFKLDEPWDSPHNIKLLDQMPDVFAIPAGGIGEKAESHATFFQVLVGPGAAFEGREGMRFPGDFPDGTSNTILIVTASRAVPWTKSEEVVYAPDQPLPPLGLHHIFEGARGPISPAITVAFVDGSTHHFGVENISEKSLRALITRNGKDEPGPDWLR